jgi:hypothetical protein
MEPSPNGHDAEAARDERAIAARAREITVEQEAQQRAAKAKAPKGKLIVRKADLSQSRPPRFAWSGRILLGYLNLLLGNEGIGKGTLAAFLLAQWSRGKVPGALKGKPACVAIVGDEDSFQDVWVPRLHAAKAVLSQVVQIERPGGGFVELRQDRNRLAQAVEDHGVKVIYLDALLDNLGVGVNDWHGKQVREALQPARSLARELGVAVIGSLHPNKSGETFRNLVSGSSAFNAVSRSSLLLAKDPDEDGRLVLVRGKGNLAAAPQAITFAIESHSFKVKRRTFNVPRAVAFRAGGELTADDLIAATAEQAKKSQRANSQVGGAELVIKELLPNDGKWHQARPILDTCKKQGFADRTVRRARELLGIEYRKSHHFQGEYEYRWPANAQPSLAASRVVRLGRLGDNPALSKPDKVAKVAAGQAGRTAGHNGKRKEKR